MNGPAPRAARSAALLAGAGVLVLAAALLAKGCDGRAPAPANPVPAAPAAPVAPAPSPPPPRAPMTVKFVDLHEDTTGFGPVNHTGIPDDKLWIAEAMGGGAILFDYDGDGLVDILFVDGNVVNRPPEPAARTRLFHNDGGMHFTDVTEKAHIDITDVGYGGAAADYDNDGLTDVYVCVLGKNHLLHNEGDGTFTDVAAEAGVQGPAGDMSTACCWGDFNGDGWLDLYVSNYMDMYAVIDRYQKMGLHGRDCDWRGFKVYCGPMPPYQLDRLYLSNGPDPKTGKVTFREATENLHGQVARPSFQCVAADFDQDGDLDIYTATDTEPNHLWINKDGKGNFEDEGMVSGCAVSGNVNPQAGMGVDVGDYDHDGKLDIVVTNFSHDYNTLYRNKGFPKKDGKGLVPSFDDVSVKTGIQAATYFALCWSAAFTDFDNDGNLDLYFSAGHVYGEIDHFAATGTSYRQKNLLLRSTGGTDPRFENVSEEAGPGFQVREVHRGGGLADLDNDGDEDMVVTVLNGPAYILRNDGGNANSWIRISLLGKRPLDPAGALVKVEAEGLLPQWKPALRGNSFISCSDSRLLFGLGKAAKASKVAVTWPSGAKSEFRDLAARAHWLLEEGVPEAKRLPR